MLKVNKRGYDKPGDKCRIHERQRNGRKRMRMIPKLQPTSQESNAGQKFHDKITRRYRRTAIFTTPAQHQPRHERDVQIPRNRIFAMRTMRWRRDDAQAQRHSVNADIQKAAHHAAKHKKAQRPKMERHRRPVMWIENGVSAHIHFFAKPRASRRAARFCLSKF